MSNIIDTPEKLDAYLTSLAKSGSEHGEQRALMAWLAFVQHHSIHPMARMVYAVPNGGARDKITAGKLKAEGVKAGFPDLGYPVPLHGYAGLFMELKARTGHVDAEQEEWHTSLTACGYAVRVVWGWRAARRCFEDYTYNRLSKDYLYEAN